MRPGKVCAAQKYVNRLVSKWTRSSIVKLAAAIAFHNGAGPIDAVPISREGEHGNAAALSPLPGQPVGSTNAHGGRREWRKDAFGRHIHDRQTQMKPSEGDW
jgi:hypothetical protein